MKKLKMSAIVSVSAVLALTMACSSNKTAENSTVTSKDDGKGTAPAAADAKQAQKALVRFVNGTTTDKDLSFNDVVAFSKLGNRDISEYKELPAERHDFKLMAPGDTATPLATNSEGLSGGKHYTIVAVTKKDGKADLYPITDDLTPPAAGQAKVRVINAAPNMENVDLYATGQKSALISGTGFESASSYKEVPPTETHLTVRHGMSKKNSAPVKDIELAAGKLYTIVVFEKKDHTLATKTIQDQLNAAPAGQ